MRWLAVLMLMVGCAHDPAEPLHNPRPRERPLEPTTTPIQEIVGGNLSPLAKRLAEIDMFSIGGVGFTGELGEGEILARELANEPDAIEMFDRLLAQPNRPARLYAYWALRTLDPARANQARGPLSVDSTKVHTTSGCLGFDRETSYVVTDIDRLPKL